MEVLLRDDELRRNPTIFEPQAQNQRQSPTLLWDKAAATGPGSEVNVTGRYYHAIQLEGVAGSDAFTIEGTIDGANWHAVSVGLTGVAANGITQFTGQWVRLRANKTAGTGTASVISLLSMAS